MHSEITKLTRTFMTMRGHYEPWLVALSFVIAAFGSYIALRLAPAWSGRSAIGEAGRVRGVLPSGTTLGLTIWAMHFTGMAAFHVHGVTISYLWPATVLSLVVAVVFTILGFATLTLLHEPREALIVAGIPMASGILSMHFLGMMAMAGDLHLHFEPGLVIGAGAIALFASIAALWMTTLRQRLLSRMGSALVMAVAICGMHYTGMAAAHFSALTPEGDPSPSSVPD